MTNQIRNPNTETEARHLIRRLSTDSSDFVIRISFAIRASSFVISELGPQERPDGGPDLWQLPQGVEPVGQHPRKEKYRVPPIIRGFGFY